MSVEQDSGNWPDMVSVDDHVVEPPKLWVDRMSAADRERSPRVVRTRVRDALKESLTGVYATPEMDQYADKWVDVWHYEEVRFPIMRSLAAAGCARGDVDTTPITYDEMRPGCYDRTERLKDMSEDGIEIALCFPNLFVRFCGQRFAEAKDKELALRCVRTYNDWLSEEWAGASGGRLHGAFILPIWDPVLAAQEAERVASFGKVICFSEIPPKLGLPSIYTGEWDRLFSVCEDAGVVIAMHIGSSSTQATSSPDAPSLLRQSNHHTITSLSLTDWLVSGVLDQHPRLKIAYAEGQAGWIPYLVARLDRFWHQNNPYIFKDVPRTSRPPGTYLKEHIYSCFFDDPTALQHLDVLGVDNLCFETDYPHPDGTWPNSRSAAARQTEHLPVDVRNKVLRENGLRLLGVQR